MKPTAQSRQLARQGRPAWPPPAARRPPAPLAANDPEQFSELAAASLYCPKCRAATPVRERLLLVLPDGNLYDYSCSVCGTSTGTKTSRHTGSGLV